MITNGLILLGSTAATVAMTTIPNGTGPLPAGTYGVWAVGQTAYIGVAQNISSASNITTTTGYPIVAGVAPVPVYVPVNGNIGFASSSSGTFSWERVGA